MQFCSVTYRFADMPSSAFYAGFDLLLTLELIDEIFRKNRKLLSGYCVYTGIGVNVHVTGSDLHARTG